MEVIKLFTYSLIHFGHFVFSVFVGRNESGWSRMEMLEKKVIINYNTLLYILYIYINIYNKNFRFKILENLNVQSE